jgi:hypothetical protein
MEQNKKQTAVEWLEEKYRSLLIEADFNDTHIFVFDERRNELFRQAKQMEKEQIKEAHSAGQESAYGFKDKETAGEYYQKTYEK